MSFITDNRRQYDALIQEVELLSNSYVLIGFQQGDVTRSENRNNRNKQPGQSQADIAAQNEFGRGNIPARPFMSTAFDNNRQRINQVIQGQYDQILEGNSTTRRSLNLIGLFMTDLIQVRIRDITTPPNSPVTIALKGSSKPLIDFGQMIQSVRHVVVMP